MKYISKLHRGIDKVFKSKIRARTRQCQINSQRYQDLRRLAVRGTLDKLAPSMIFRRYKVITVEHPADSGYTKKVRVLSDRGRKILEKLRVKRQRRTSIHIDVRGAKCSL